MIPLLPQQTGLAKEALVAYVEKKKVIEVERGWMKVKNKYIHTPFGLSFHLLNAERDTYLCLFLCLGRSPPHRQATDKPKQHGLVLVLTFFLYRPEIHHTMCE